MSPESDNTAPPIIWVESIAFTEILRWGSAENWRLGSLLTLPYNPQKFVVRPGASVKRHVLRYLQMLLKDVLV
jgi:hypothetical protein